MTRGTIPAVMLALQAQPVTPVIIRVVAAPAKEISVADILLGSVGITGLFLIGAALLGFVLGALFILLRRWRDAHGTSEPAESAFHLTVPPK